MAIPRARLGRLEKQNLGEEVAEHIREEIFSGGLRPGDKVPQDEIAATLGVSRLPVRQAIIGLEADGLVKTEPHRGTFVLEVTPTDLRDHYTIVGVIHGLAASRAAAMATRADFDELTALHERMFATEDTEDVYRLHWRFHQTINRLGGSRRLRSVLKQLSHNLPRSLFTSISPMDVDPAVSHASILESLKSRDEAGVAALCQAHLEHEAELVIRHLREASLWGANGAQSAV